jgi:hypothetical protein
MRKVWDNANPKKFGENYVFQNCLQLCDIFRNASLHKMRPHSSGLQTTWRMWTWLNSGRFNNGNANHAGRIVHKGFRVRARLSVSSIIIYRKRVWACQVSFRKKTFDFFKRFRVILIYLTTMLQLYALYMSNIGTWSWLIMKRDYFMSWHIDIA